MVKTEDEGRLIIRQCVGHSKEATMDLQSALEEVENEDSVEKPKYV